MLRTIEPGTESLGFSVYSYGTIVPSSTRLLNCLILISFIGEMEIMIIYLHLLVGLFED